MLSFKWWLRLTSILIGFLVLYPQMCSSKLALVGFWLLLGDPCSHWKWIQWWRALGQICECILSIRELFTSGVVLVTDSWLSWFGFICIIRIERKPGFCEIVFFLGIWIKFGAFVWWEHSWCPKACDEISDLDQFTWWSHTWRMRWTEGISSWLWGTSRWPSASTDRCVFCVPPVHVFRVLLHFWMFLQFCKLQEQETLKDLYNQDDNHQELANYYVTASYREKVGANRCVMREC